MILKHVKGAGRDTSTKGKVFVAILITIFFLPPFWNLVCVPGINWFAH